MTIIDIACVAFGLAGWAYAVRCYVELWRWARQCQGARIVIAYKRKVQLQAPLVEWLGWCNQLQKDEKSGGRVVWRNGYASVAITKAPMPTVNLRQLLKRVKGQKGTVAPARQGRWDATDQTPEANKRVQV